jgi:hypothetical protein
MPIGLITHQDAVRREDLVDYITNVDYKNTPLYSGLGKATATNTLHEWAVDTFGTPANSPVIEGSDATTVDHTQPARRNNIVQMFRKVITVSDTEKAVDVAGMSDPYAYQLKKATVEMARDIETAIVTGTIASGASGVARAMNGAIAQISTNKTANASGTSLSVTKFNDILAGIFNNGTDEVANEVYVGSYLKRVISGYTAGNTKNVNAADKRIWDTVNVYESDFGTIRIYLSRFIPTGGALFIRPEYFKVAYLAGRAPKHIALAKTGSSTKGMVEGELTLESLAEKASAYNSGFFVG